MFEHVFDPRLVACNQRWVNLGEGKLLNPICKVALQKRTFLTGISAGKFKVEGNPYVPLDEQAQAFMQSRVDDYYNAFVEAVARLRSA